MFKTSLGGFRIRPSLNQWLGQGDLLLSKQSPYPPFSNHQCVINFEFLYRWESFNPSSPKHLLCDTRQFHIWCATHLEKNFINFPGGLPLALQPCTDQHCLVREWPETEITGQGTLPLNKDYTRIRSVVAVLMWKNYSEFCKSKAPGTSQYLGIACEQWREGMRQLDNPAPPPMCPILTLSLLTVVIFFISGELLHQRNRNTSL